MDEDLVSELSNLEGKSSVVFIDYVQKIPTNSTSTIRYTEVQKTMEKIRETAVKTNLPIIVGAQTNRQAEGEEPQLHHLRESGDIEQDASVVIAIHNYRYHKASKDEKEEKEVAKFVKMNAVKLIVLKNRFGVTGNLYLEFDGRIFKFSEP
ncbi:MAG: DnaB-like helicase C-terminal domain-containing protein [Candidatus Methanomethylicaceae archaeon]